MIDIMGKRRCRICKSLKHTSCTLCNGCGHSRNECTFTANPFKVQSYENNDDCKMLEMVEITEQTKIITHENKECPICSTIIEDDSCTTLCNHTFCSSCFLKAFTLKETCPLCREQNTTALSVIEEKNKLLKDLDEAEKKYKKLYDRYKYAELCCLVQ